MSETRFLCSHLVRVTGRGSESVGVLEEIWEYGARIDCEAAIPVGTPVHIDAGDRIMNARVTELNRDGVIGVEFAAPWNPADWMPQHALRIPTAGPT